MMMPQDVFVDVKSLLKSKPLCTKCGILEQQEDGLCKLCVMRRR